MVHISNVGRSVPVKYIPRCVYVSQNFPTIFCCESELKWASATNGVIPHRLLYTRSFTGWPSNSQNTAVPIVCMRNNYAYTCTQLRCDAHVT